LETKARFPGRYDQIREIGRFVLQAAVAIGFDERTCYHIELACDEACTNVIEHGYKGEDNGEISVEWQQHERDFRVLIEDEGTTFDSPDTLASLPAAGSTHHDVAVGGLGMHFMRTLMDDIHYERIGNKNRVTLMKWLPSDKSVVVRETLDGVPVVRVFGRLDTSLTDELEEVLNGLVATERPKLIVDLAETTYCNSAGLRTLVTAWRHAHQKGGDVILVNLNERVQEIFAMVGFDKIFRICDNRVDAVAFLLGES
jgi:anti-anti-sigma factor